MKTKRFYIIGAILLGLCTIFTFIALGFGLSHAVKKASANETEGVQNYRTPTIYIPIGVNTNSTSPNFWIANIGYSFIFDIIQQSNSIGVLCRYNGYTNGYTIPMENGTYKMPAVLEASFQQGYKTSIWTWEPITGYTTSEVMRPTTLENSTIDIQVTNTPGDVTVSNLQSISITQIPGEGGDAETWGYIDVSFNFLNNKNLRLRFNSYLFTPFGESTYTILTTAGANAQYQAGYSDGVQSQKGNITNAYNQGYNAGHAAGTAQSTKLGNILLSVGGVPFETLKSMLDFDLLGVNISSLIMSILTAAVAIWLVKLFI